MKTVKNLSLIITYEVGYGNVTMPDNVFEEFKKASKNGDAIMASNYPNAAEWMTSNVRERDCFDWNAVTVDDIDDKEESNTEKEVKNV